MDCDAPLLRPLEGRFALILVVMGRATYRSLVGLASLLAIGWSLTSEDFGRDLARWSGGNLRRLAKSEQTRFTAYVRGTLVREDSHRGFEGDPSWALDSDSSGDAYVWRYLQSKSPEYLVLINPHGYVHPSAEHGWLFFVDSRGSIIRKDDFDIGYRMYSRAATYETVSWLSFPVLVQRMEVTSGGQGPAKIYIAFDGRRPAVVGVDDENGAIRSMDYFAPNWVVGPAYYPRTVVEVERYLTGRNEVKRFEALVWLLGNHKNEFPRPGSENRRSETEIRWEKAHRYPPIVQAVQKLRFDENAWVRLTAQLVPIKD